MKRFFILFNICLLFGIGLLTLSIIYEWTQPFLIGCGIGALAYQLWQLLDLLWEPKCSSCKNKPLVLNLGVPVHIPCPKCNK